MILTAPGATEFIYADGLPAGLAGTLQVELLNMDDTVAEAPTVLGITQLAPSRYRAQVTVPTTPGDYQPRWINGPSIYDDTEVLRVQAVPSISPGYTTGGWLDNRPILGRLKRQLAGATLDPAVYTDAVLQEQLNASLAWVEDVAATRFNGIKVSELYDGNTTNQIVVRKRPVTSVILLTVETPILGFIRTYDQTELKVYRKQGVTKVFTYKLAVEQALFNTLDYQAWGTIFPPLPQCVHVTYTYGYPQYHPTLNETTLDGGLTVLAGDQRDPEELNWLENLSQAAVLDAAAAALTMVGAEAGTVQSMSFDGYSRTLNPSAYQPQVQAWVEKRDELLKRRRRQFVMSTIG